MSASLLKIRRPTLRRRMATALGTMVLATIAVGIGAIVAVDGLHQDLSVASRGFRQLRQLYDVGFLASRARTATDATPPDPAASAGAARAAVAALDARGGAVDGPPPNWSDESARADCRRLLTATPVPFDRLFARLSTVSADVRRSITEAQAAADRRRVLAVRFVAGLCAAVAAAAVAVGVHQYRRVITPVRQLAAGTRRFAAGQFDPRITPTGDAEFVALAGDFNRMADDLQQIYRDLEDRVRVASQELARSERLASVGHLAAGVAHEINNPLGIIAGYGERALRQLPDAADRPDVGRARHALTVICDEAFRCKAITDRLLSLARPGEAGRSPVPLVDIANDVVTAVAALPAFAGRHVQVTTGGDTTATVSAGEIRQVVLNLVVNALQATPPNGTVTIAVQPVSNGVELSVTDTGRGLTADELARVFEPFYTARPATAGHPAGTGLGLSIAHAIIAGHGGRLTAESEGRDRGSRFTIRLRSQPTGGAAFGPSANRS